MALRRRAADLGLRFVRQQGALERGLLQHEGLAAQPALDLAGVQAPAGVRYASQLAVKQRMRSVTNIQKITKAMKMVAASKMRVAQASTMQSRGIVVPLVKLLGDHPAAKAGKNVAVPITSDKGLCGGINSSVTKYTRATMRVLAAQGDDKDQLIWVVGEKGRAQLIRVERDRIAGSIADVSKAAITFPQTCMIAEEVLKSEYDAVRIIYNRFQSAISFKPTISTVLSPDALEKSAEAGGAIDQYEVEGPDRAEMLQDLAEFQLATALYNGFLENNCSEQASRMQAMENSTKNASEMLGKLTLTYNRTRQAAITTELTEIISGAAALEG